MATAGLDAFAEFAAPPGLPAGELPAGATSHFAQINGIRLHYVSIGSGPVVILLHGWPQTWFAWHGLMPHLATRFRVIAPDLRGTGLSERTKSGYDKRTIAEDVRALIVHAGVTQAHVVGHDMGGKAAYVLAHLYPEIVAKLVLVDCLLPGKRRTWTPCVAVRGTTDFTWHLTCRRCSRRAESEITLELRYGHGPTGRTPSVRRRFRSMPVTMQAREE